MFGRKYKIINIKYKKENNCLKKIYGTSTGFPPNQVKTIKVIKKKPK